MLDITSFLAAVLFRGSVSSSLDSAWNIKLVRNAVNTKQIVGLLVMGWIPDPDPSLRRNSVCLVYYSWCLWLWEALKLLHFSGWFSPFLLIHGKCFVCQLLCHSYPLLLITSYLLLQRTVWNAAALYTGRLMFIQWSFDWSSTFLGTTMYQVTKKRPLTVLRKIYSQYWLLENPNQSSWPLTSWNI